MVVKGLETVVYELSDGRVLGIRAFEILSFPSITAFGNNKDENLEKNGQTFEQIFSEFYKFCNNSICMEFLWISEKIDNQTFSSKIHIFGVLRKVGNNKVQVSEEVDVIYNNIFLSIVSLQYNIKEINIKQTKFISLLDSVDDNCVFGIIKREKTVANCNSIFPYYFSEIVPGDNIVNFNSLITLLSQQENCGVSFQIFPTCFSTDEVFLINEVSAELSQISSGTMINQKVYRDSSALEPLKVYSYYSERRNSPIFLYNILTFGKRPNCTSLATKLISLLQSGKNKVVSTDFMCIDLSNEGIDLCKQFPNYVWNINNRLVYYYRNKKVQKALPIAKRLFRLPYLMSVEEISSFFRLPLYENSMAALNSNQIVHVQEQFSKDVVDKNNIQFGTLLSYESSKIIIGCPEKVFTKHALIVGMPGSGKTTFSINILLQFVKKNIPFLAIEPTKTEYRAMIDAIPDLQIFTPGNNSVSPYIINPFIPPKGIRIEQYIPSLVSAFKAAFSMPSPLDMIFLKAIRACYIQYGWKDYSQQGDEDVTPFGLYEFILVFKKMIKNMDYSKDVRGNIESAGLLRLTNLIEQNSNIYDTVNTVPIEDLLTKPTVLELNSIDNAEQKSLIMALLLINICLYTKHNHAGDGTLKNVLLIDEAHVLLGGGIQKADTGNPDSQATTVKALQDMIVEIRSYGTSIIIADQSPSKVSREIVANTDIKVSFRLVQSVEKELIADSMNMSDESIDNLSRLKPGEAYVYYSQLDVPQLILTEDIREKEGIRLSVLDQEVAKRMIYWKTHQSLLIPYSECRFCNLCVQTCDFYIRAEAEFISSKAFEKYRTSIRDASTLKKCIYYLPKLMTKEYESYPKKFKEKLQICSRIKLYRKVTLELPIILSEKEKEIVIKKRIMEVNDVEEGENNE